MGSVLKISSKVVIIVYMGSILVNTGLLSKTLFWIKNELFKLKPQPKKTLLPFNLPDSFPIEIQVKEKKIPHWIISSIPFLKVAIIKLITKNDDYDSDKRLIDSILDELRYINKI